VTRNASALIAGFGLALLPLPLAAQTNAPAKPAAWKFTASAAIKETFDDNVFLQSVTAQADREALVTSLLPQVGVAWKPSPAFQAGLNYSPEVHWFDGESSEDFVLHRAALNLSGKENHTAYEVTGLLVVIDGSSVGPTWTGAGGAPVAGGPVVRDRRDAAMYRGQVRVTQELGDWLIRPVATLYVHDFQTDQRSTAGYQNYADRNEFTGGVDVGRRIAPLTAWVGYRFGVQDQARLLQFPEEYDNTFHRVVFGLEGAPVSWAKLNLGLGPEFRRYGNKVPASFGDRERVNLFVDSSLTLLPTKQDTLTLSVKLFEQPGFGGRSTYRDLTCDVTGRHKFNAAWTVGLGARAYNTDFLKPVVRDDWIYSGSAFVNWNVTKQLNAELSYTLESGQSDDPNTVGREYQRQMVAHGVKYTFN
jgi:hypothetical protein